MSFQEWLVPSQPPPHPGSPSPGAAALEICRGLQASLWDGHRVRPAWGERQERGVGEGKGVSHRVGRGSVLQALEFPELHVPPCVGEGEAGYHQLGAGGCEEDLGIGVHL